MFILNARLRKKLGKSPSRRLRALDKLPAVIYGGKKTTLAIELDHAKVWNMQIKNEFYREIITIILNGREEKVRVQAVQRHVFKPKITHIDFIRKV